jgi:hypothetical protein
MPKVAYLKALEWASQGVGMPTLYPTQENVNLSVFDQ